MTLSSLVRQHWAALRALLVLTVIVGIALLWWQLRRLWSEAGPTPVLLHAQNGASYIPAPQEHVGPERNAAAHEVIVVEERAHPER
jgi:cytoskeletal protein RodZ